MNNNTELLIEEGIEDSLEAIENIRDKGQSLLSNLNTIWASYWDAHKYAYVAMKPHMKSMAKAIDSIIDILS